MKKYVLSEKVAILQIERLKRKAKDEIAKSDNAGDVDLFDMYDEKFTGDDCILLKRDGDVRDGFIAGDASEARQSTKLQEFEYEVFT